MQQNFYDPKIVKLRCSKNNMV